MRIGIVVTELLDGRFVPWESSLAWESYLDLYCLALQRRGHTCIKYVPSIGAKGTETYRHKFGHEVRRVSAYHKLLAPRWLLRPRLYSFGYTTVARQLLAPSFAVNLLKEAIRDHVQILHYSSYYSAFFVPAFLSSVAMPVTTQYTGGTFPLTQIRRILWKLSVIPSLKICDGVFLGDYKSEISSLAHELGVDKDKQFYFDVPVIDKSVFREIGRKEAQKQVGFDSEAKNVLSATYIPHRHSLFLGKDPFLMVDIFAQALKIEPHLMLHIVGWGVGEHELKQHVRSKRIEERVRFHGKVAHHILPIYYSASDVIFVPYRLERLNQGSVTAEAFACNRPVVAFKRDRTNQTEQAGGFLIEDEPSQGARTLVERIRQSDYLVQKGREALAVSEKFSIEVAGERLEMIYSRILSSRK